MVSGEKVFILPSNITLNWTSAQDYCNKHNAVLANFPWVPKTTSPVNENLRNIVMDIERILGPTAAGSLWTGLKARNSFASAKSAYQWGNGDIADIERVGLDLSPETSPCIAFIRKLSTWLTTPCSIEMNFVCEAGKQRVTGDFFWCVCVCVRARAI